MQNSLHHEKMMKKQEFMLTAKDVLYLSDLLDQTLVLNLRIGNDVTMIKDKDVKKCFEKVNKTLCEQYDTMLQVLEREAN